MYFNNVNDINNIHMYIKTVHFFSCDLYIHDILKVRYSKLNKIMYIAMSSIKFKMLFKFTHRHPGTQLSKPINSNQNQW